MKRVSGVALINIFDYPRNNYSAYWELAWPIPSSDPATPGYVWKAAILSYEPVTWLYNGAHTETKPEVPAPEYPRDLPVGLPARATVGDYPGLRELALSWGFIAGDSVTVEQIAASRIRACERIHAKLPQPVHVLEEAVGAADTEDEARVAGQTWVLEHMPAYRRVAPLRNYTDEQIDGIVELFDVSRLRNPPDFTRVDTIRGLLRANGITLYAADGTPEAESPIGYEGNTTWKRG
jgi:hypothetical protein